MDSTTLPKTFPSDTGIRIRPFGHSWQLIVPRLNQEIKRRTLLVRIFPDEASCLRLVQALAVETHEEWVDENRYLNMDLLRDHMKRALPQPKAA
jgi:transposase-like protein